MKKIKFNWDYFYPIYKEGDLIKKVAKKIQRISCQNKRVLVIVPALVGDFVATVPAIFDYIQRNPEEEVDLVVTPPLKKLASRIRGVKHVYGAKSIAERQGEHHEGDINTPLAYEKIIILRVSADVLENISPYLMAENVVTLTWPVFKYGLFELFLKNVFRKRPKQWRDFNFDLLGGENRKISFEEIFDTFPEDREAVPSLEGLQQNSKKIVIHTGASWHMMRWENDRWVELLKKIHEFGDYHFIFIGSEKDKADYDYITSRLNFKTSSYISKVDLWTLTLTLAQMDYFLGIDSGPGNIAHLVGLRNLIIYGPGPHTFFSNHAEDIALDKSNGRGLYQRFFVKKNGFIHRITAQEVFDGFKRLVKD